jgi:hypothetical protein
LLPDKQEAFAMQRERLVQLVLLIGIILAAYMAYRYMS